jgi:hypothetical protein
VKFQVLCEVVPAADWMCVWEKRTLEFPVTDHDLWSLQHLWNVPFEISVHFVKRMVMLFLAFPGVDVCEERNCFWHWSSCVDTGFISNVWVAITNAGEEVAVETVT